MTGTEFFDEMMKRKLLGGHVKSRFYGNIAAGCRAKKMFGFGGKCGKWLLDGEGE